MISISHARSKYQVHAELLRSGSDAEEFDDAKAGHPMERRLNRIERVSAAYRGRIDLRFNNVVLMTFDTADAAVLSACEMQSRCAVLPQVLRQRLTLRIGIHQISVRQRSKDDGDKTSEIASRLAFFDDGIIISQPVLEAINADLRKITRPLNDSPVGTAAHLVDWRSEIPSAAYGGESFWPSHMSGNQIGPYLLLHYGLKTLELSEDSRILTIGRDPACDLVLNDVHVSRNHCRIERLADRIMLTDSSTNGTAIATDDGADLLIKQSSFVLRGKGLLFFGRPYRGERRGGVRYEAQ